MEKAGFLTTKQVARHPAPDDHHPRPPHECQYRADRKAGGPVNRSNQYLFHVRWNHFHPLLRGIASVTSPDPK
jgi:hypothetical protein